jgi:hypothetical protein
MTKIFISETHLSYLSKLLNFSNSQAESSYGYFNLTFTKIIKFKVPGKNSPTTKTFH